MSLIFFKFHLTLPGKLQSVVVSEFPCGDDALGVHRCPGSSQCKYWKEGPNYGLVSFEDFRKGLLTVFQLITLEGWSSVFYLVSSYGNNSKRAALGRPLVRHKKTHDCMYILCCVLRENFIVNVKHFGVSFCTCIVRNWTR